MSQNNSSSVTSEIKQSLKLSLPLIATYLVQSSSGFVGTIMLAHLGTDALAAGALVGGIYMTIVVFLFGILAAVSVLVSQSYGAKDQKGISWATSQGFIVAILVTLPMVLAMWFSPFVLKWSGQNPQVVALSVEYLHALIWGIIPLGFLVVIEQFLIGIGKTRIVFFWSLCEVPLEIVGSYVLIFGKFGFPKLGIAGLAYAFALVFTLVFICLFLYTAYGKQFRKYHIYGHLREVNWTYIWELIRVGTPIGVMYIIEVAFYMVIAFLMGRFGVIKLAAHQIVNQYSGFTFMIILAISQAVTVQVGHAVGRGDKAGVKRAAYTSQGVAIVMMLIISMAYWFLPNYLMMLDINVHAVENQPLIHTAVLFFAIMAFAQLGDTFRFTAIGILRGLKDTTIPLYVSAFIFWVVALPLSYLMSFKWHMGAVGLWLGLALGIAIGAVILWRRLEKLFDRIVLEDLLI